MDTQKEQKRGLWEDGRRVVWFTAEQEEQIESGELDYRSFFKKPENQKAKPVASAKFHQSPELVQSLEALVVKFPLAEYAGVSE